MCFICLYIRSYSSGVNNVKNPSKRFYKEKFKAFKKILTNSEKISKF